MVYTGVCMDRLPRWSPHPSLWRCSSPQPSTICQTELPQCASLTATRCRLSTYMDGCRAFDYAGPTIWNSLPNELKNSDSFDSFKRFMKTILFGRYWVRRIRGHYSASA